MFYSFVWNDHPDKIKRNISRQKVISGGLGMVDIRSFDQCLKLTWIRKLITGQSNWKTLIEYLYPELLQMYKYGNTFVYKTKTKIKKTNSGTT